MGDLGSSPPPAFVPSRAERKADSVPAKGSACMLQAEDGPKGSVLKTVVGSTVETREEHTERCTTPSCPRCRWYARGKVWQAAYGTMETRAGPREQRVWLTERPARWKGAWALGCILCADALARRTPGTPADHHQGRRGPRWRTSCKWARFEVRTMHLQAEHVKQHACTDNHKLAEQAWLRPDEPVCLGLQASYSDDGLLAGAVPLTCGLVAELAVHSGG